MQEPVLLLSPARSASSVVVSMLGQHPQLASVPELRLFHRDRVGDLLSDRLPGFTDDPRLAGLLRTISMVESGCQTSKSILAARDWLGARTHWRSVEVFEHIRRHFLPRGLVEKSPETVRTPQALGRALASYPKARFVHLVRHPWASVRSMVQVWAPLPWWQVERARAHTYCARHWLEQHRLIEVALRVAGVRHTRVRAEDFTRPGVEALDDFCRWANIATGHAVLRRMQKPERSCFSSTGPVEAEGGLDIHFLQSPALRHVSAPPHLSPDPRWNIPSSLESEVRGAAEEFGYVEGK